MMLNKKRLIMAVLVSIFAVGMVYASNNSIVSNKPQSEHKMDKTASKIPNVKAVVSNKSTNNTNKNVVTEKKDIVLSGKPTQNYTEYRKGADFLQKFEQDVSVNYIILVEQSKDNITHANLTLLSKNEGKWITMLSCAAYLGKNGIDKIKEGDGKTPTGDYGIRKEIGAFGIKDKPDTKLKYTKITDSMYCCGDNKFYNQIVDIKDEKFKHDCSGEHLIKYNPQYNYCLFLDYNDKCERGKGSAIFLHCTGSYDYTLGCISVKEDNMLKILANVDENIRICVFPYVVDVKKPA